jgi:hypothetical protein
LPQLDSKIYLLAALSHMIALSFKLISRASMREIKDFIWNPSRWEGPSSASAASPPAAYLFFILFILFILL